MAGLDNSNEVVHERNRNERLAKYFSIGGMLFFVVGTFSIMLYSPGQLEPEEAITNVNVLAPFYLLSIGFDLLLVVIVFDAIEVKEKEEINNLAFIIGLLLVGGTLITIILVIAYLVSSKSEAISLAIILGPILFGMLFLPLVAAQYLRDKL